MIISQIAAMSRNRVIGVDNALPWNMPNDLAYFFRVTKGHHIIMGRRNYEANGRALPDRVNIVITRNNSYHAPGCIVVETIEEALKYSQDNDQKEIFIVGGGEIYKATLDITDKIYLTIIDTELEGDVFFPKLNLNHWRMTFREAHSADESNPFNYTYYIYEKNKFY